MFGLSLFGFCTLFHSSVLAAIVPYTTVTTPAIAPRADDAVPTYTVGDTTNYLVAEPTNAAPSGGSLNFYPGGFHETTPEEGIDIVFGPDLQKRIGEVMKENCADGKDLGKCATELTKVLPTTDMTTHSKRFVPVAYAAVEALIAVAGIVMATVFGEAVAIHNQEPPKVVHFSPDSLEDIGRLSSASIVAIATGSEDELAGTATASQQAVPTDGGFVSVTVATEDDGEVRKDDLIINIPEPVSTRFRDFIAMLGGAETTQKCQKGLSRRLLTKRVPPADTLPEECVNDILNYARAALDSTPNMLAQMVPQDPNNPLNPQNNPLGGAVPNLNVHGDEVILVVVRQYVPNRVLNDQELAIAVMLGALIVNVVYFLILMAPQTAPLTVPIGKEVLSSHDLDSFKCSADLVCIDPSCGGEILLGPTLGRKKSFQTGFCRNAPDKYCACEYVIDGFAHELDTGYIEAQWDYLEELISIADGKLDDVEVDCVQGGVKAHYPKEYFQADVKKACQDHSELRKRESRSGIGKRDTWHWENSKPEWDKFVIWFDWDDQGDCKFTCEEVFNKIAETETCSSQYEISRSVTVKTGCGDASFTINEWSPPIGNNEFELLRLDIIQETGRNGGSYVEWRLYAGETQSKIEGPSRARTLQSPAFLVELEVDEPDNDELTNIRFMISSRVPGSERRERCSTGTKTADWRTRYIDQKAIIPFCYCNAGTNSWNWIPDTGNMQRRVSCMISRHFDDVFHDRCERDDVFCINIGKEL